MAKEVIRVVAAVVERNDCYLLTQRMPNAVLPMLWEFPGGRVEPGESDEDALLREVEHRIGVEITIVSQIGVHLHEYKNYNVHMTLFACCLANDTSEPQAATVHEIVWAKSNELDKYEFPPADQGTMDRLLGISN